MTTQTYDPLHPSASMTLAVAQARIAELRADAEHAHRVGTARGPLWARSWPVGLAAALRHSLASALPTSRSAACRQSCPTC